MAVVEGEAQQPSQGETDVQGISWWKNGGSSRDHSWVGVALH